MNQELPSAKEIGLRIKRLRENKNMSREDLASKIGTSLSAVGMYELGERIPRDEYKAKIANIFETSIESIFLVNSVTNSDI